MCVCVCGGGDRRGHRHASSAVHRFEQAVSSSAVFSVLFGIFRPCPILTLQSTFSVGMDVVVATGAAVVVDARHAQQNRRVVQRKRHATMWRIAHEAAETSAPEREGERKRARVRCVCVCGWGGVGVLGSSPAVVDVAGCVVVAGCVAVAAAVAQPPNKAAAHGQPVRHWGHRPMVSVRHSIAGTAAARSSCVSRQPLHAATVLGETEEMGLSKQGGVRLGQHANLTREHGLAREASERTESGLGRGGQMQR